MAWVSDEQIAAVQQRERQLAEYFSSLEGRIQGLEQKPGADSMSEQWSNGRKHARSKGYNDQDINRLEEFMEKRSVWHHSDAMRLDPVGPSPKLWGIGGLPEDEMRLLTNGDLDGFERLAVSRALSE